MAKAGVFINIVAKADSGGFAKARSELDALERQSVQAGTGIAASLDRAQAKLGGLASKASSVGKQWTTKATLPIVGALGLAAKAAADEDQQIAKLDQTLRKNTGSTKAQRDAVEAWITKMQNATGVADDELRPAMQKLIIGGRSVKQAQHDLAIAMDIAAARGKPLSTVVEAMSKAAQGNTGALGRLGIATKGTSTDWAGLQRQGLAVERSMKAAAAAERKYGKDSLQARTARQAAGDALAKYTELQKKGSQTTLTYDEILKKASKTMGGQAAAAANTSAGRLAIMKAKFDDMVEDLGRKVLPIGERLLDWFGRLMGWLQRLPSGAQNFLLIGAAAAAAVGPLSYLVAGGAKAAQGVLAVGKAGIKVAGGIKSGVQAVGRFADGFKNAQAAASSFSGKAGTIGGKVRGAVDALRKGGSVALSWGKSVGTVALNAIKQFGAQIARAAIVVVTEWIPSLISSAVAILAATWPILAVIAAIGLLVAAGIWLYQNWDTVWNGIKAVAEAVWNFIKAVVSAYIDFIVGYIKLELEILRAIWDTAWEVVKTIVNGAIDFVKWVVTDGIGGVISFFAGLPGKILDALGDLGSLLLDAGRELMNGIIEGLKAAWHLVVDWIKDKVGSIPGMIGDFLGIGSPSKYTTAHGEWLMQGLELGMKKRIGRTVNAAKAHARSLRDALTGKAEAELDVGRIRSARRLELVAAGGSSASARARGAAGTVQITIPVDARGSSDPTAIRSAAERGARAGAQTAIAQLTHLRQGA